MTSLPRSEPLPLHALDHRACDRLVTLRALKSLVVRPVAFEPTLSQPCHLAPHAHGLCELQTAARSLGLGVFGGECGRSLQASDAIFVVMVGVLPRVPRRDRAKRGRAGDRVYRVCLPEATPGERPSNVLAVGHALREACQKDALSWVGNCRDGGLIAVVDWLETTGKGLRLEPVATGRAALVDPEPDAFFIAALGDTNPAGLLPDNVKVVEVGSIEPHGSS